MDAKDWEPANDKYLGFPYDVDTLETGKAIAKDTLQAELGLPVRGPAIQLETTTWLQSFCAPHLPASSTSL